MGTTSISAYQKKYLAKRYIEGLLKPLPIFLRLLQLATESLYKSLTIAYITEYKSWFNNPDVVLHGHIMQYLIIQKSEHCNLT